MSTRKAVAVALCALISLAAVPPGAAAAEAVGKVTHSELAIEAFLSQAALPSNASGLLVITRCTGCTPVSLTATSATQWLIGKESVSFAALRMHAAKTRNADITAFYSKSTRELTRLRISER
jgi:hypothetical protein